MDQPRQLVLASTSAYRRALLRRLPLHFVTAAPDADETPLAGERPPETAWRLSMDKARAVARRYPEALVIGSDQVAALGEERLGKPGDHANALRQLRQLSGKAADFHTAVSLLDARTGEARSHIVACRVVFRSLDERQIENYLRFEQPYDCAGSAKSEGLGIVLIERIETEDPTSLIGLPLIALSTMLGQAGMPVLG
ncbi:MAG TPA: Maf family nucleotide pyrophosphatase [Burkholderiales bacterium]|nr:Maf family nucleotide pyrophosphatase [Burkholderiales bacterium]